MPLSRFSALYGTVALSNSGIPYYDYVKIVCCQRDHPITSVFKKGDAVTKLQYCVDCHFQSAVGHPYFTFTVMLL